MSQDQSELRVPGGAASLDTCFSRAEYDFYSRYAWCLNPFPSIGQVVSHLRAEVEHLQRLQSGWQADEVLTNIALLACSLSDSADDHLAEANVDLSKLEKKMPAAKPWLSLAAALLNGKERVRRRSLEPLRRWRLEWEDALQRFLRFTLSIGNACPGVPVAPPVGSGETPLPSQARRDDREELLGCKRSALALAEVLEGRLPGDLLQRPARNPAAFRSQDLSFYDVLKLGEKFCAVVADKKKPLLIVGLRTAGSYFAPVLHAYLATHGYCDVQVTTMRPKQGVDRLEKERLAGVARRGGMAVVIDEPIYKGETLGLCLSILSQGGFAPESVAVLFPLHPTVRDWTTTEVASALTPCLVVTLAPEEYFKCERLQKDHVQHRLQEYFCEQGWRGVSVVEHTEAEICNGKLQEGSEEKFHTRLKRVYAVRLESPSGQTSTRFVLAKSVGWGWFAYQAALAANRLEGLIPPVFGLRDGIMYSEWIKDGEIEAARPPEGLDRTQLVSTVAAYVAARAKGLAFSEDPSPTLCRAGLQSGAKVLERELSRPCKWPPLAVLRRREIRQQLSSLSCPVPALVDGKMRLDEWVRCDHRLVKSDFEQHGLGKIELSVTDPAYDLADAILAFDFSPEEEAVLLDLYGEQAGDRQVGKRMPLYKLLCGFWNMRASLDCIKDPRLTRRHCEHSDAYMRAWTFSMIQMARYCAGFVPRPGGDSSSRALVVSDVDGVLDRHLSGVPCCTPAGVRALCLLRSHGVPVAINTARSLDDVKAYCEAYGFVGGVAESGSCVVNAATGEERVLVSAEARAKIASVRAALERVPGVFTNPFYRHSIKAFTYGKATTEPVASAVLEKIIVECGAEALQVRQTGTDSAIVSGEVDKGSGLLALVDLLGRGDAEAIAIGDTEPDLAMFRVAKRGYAPSHTPVREAAEALGCRIAKQPYQKGFLEIVREIVHPDGKSCPKCGIPALEESGQDRILLEYLRTAETGRLRSLLGVAARGGLRRRRRGSAEASSSVGSTEVSAEADPKPTRVR